MMSEDASEKPISEMRSTPSATPTVQELLERLLAGLEMATADLTKARMDVQVLWDRAGSFLKQEASRVNHVLTLASAVERDRASRDRQTDAVTLCVQKLTEIYDQREYIRAGLDNVVQAINARGVAEQVGQEVGQKVDEMGKKVEERVAEAQAQAAKKVEAVQVATSKAVEGRVVEAQATAAREVAEAVVDAQADVTREMRKVVRKAVREATGSHRTHRAEEDEIVGRVGAATKLIRAVDRTRLATKVLIFVLAVLVSAYLGGRLLLEIRRATEEPRGAPIELAPGHRERARDLPPAETK